MVTSLCGRDTVRGVAPPSVVAVVMTPTKVSGSSTTLSSAISTTKGTEVVPGGIVKVGLVFS